MSAHDPSRRARGLRTHLVTMLAPALALSSAVAWGAPVAARHSAAERLADPRWVPWAGCWELVLETLPREDRAVQDAVVCLSPSQDGPEVRITTLAEDERPLEEVFVVDGQRRPLEEPGCRGWRSAEWSRDGHRIFVSSELACGDEEPRLVSGINLIENGLWVDIQVIRSETTRELVIRKYRPGPRIGSTPPATPPLTVAGVIEATRRVDPVAVEAALMETDPELDVSAKTLIDLSDAAVDPELIDLMVALAYPERFQIGRAGRVVHRAATRSRGSDSAGYGPLLGRFGPYAYLFPFYYAPFGYYENFLGGFPYGGARYVLTPRQGDSADTPGRVINGRGYTRIRPRPSGPGAVAGGYSSGSNGYRQAGGSSDGGVSTSGYAGGSGSSVGTAKPREN